MLCKHCGKKISTGTDVCPECHGSLRPNAAPAKPNAAFMKEETEHAVIWYLKKKTVLMVVAVLAVLAAASAAVPAVFSFFDRVDYTAFVRIEAAGYDGRGTAEVQLDTDGLSQRLFGKPEEELDKTERKTFGRVTDLLWNGLETEGSRTGLSNGDTLVFRITNLEALDKAAGKKSKNRAEISYTVEGLLEAKAVRFEDLFEVAFTGTEGSGCVLVTPKENDLGWSVAGYGTEVYIQDQSYGLTSQSGNAGALSNGDTFTIGAAPLWGDVGEYFLENYGAYVSDEEASYTVSGLTEAQSVDVFSLVETSVTGVDGAGKLAYHWGQEEYALGGVRLVPLDSQSNGFSLYAGAAQSDSIIFQAPGSESGAREQDLGRFYLTADKDGGVSVGDTVTITIRADRFDALEGDTLRPYGVTFPALEKAIDVDAAMIPRYITSMEQVNEVNLGALSGRMGAEVSGSLQENWSRVVHGNSSYTCYDQTIVAGPAAHEAHLVCMDRDSNTYAIFIVYGVVVTDSELEGNVGVYALMRLDDPVIYQDGDGTIGYAGSMRMEFYDSLEPIRGSWWYQSEDGYRVAFG